MRQGFDNEKYLKIQSEHIKKRIEKFGDKLYLEFGGKLYDDNHASRVLPGFQPDSKLKMLMQLKDDCEIIMVISAKDIEKNKVRSDLGITYDMDLLRETLATALREAAKYEGFHIHYAVKANFNPVLLAAVKEQGMGADCVSGGEVKAAINAGIPAEKVVFAGVGKTDREIAYALDAGIFCFCGSENFAKGKCNTLTVMNVARAMNTEFMKYR